MQPPFSPHSHFFSSLKQVEKRLKLESSSSSAVSLPPPPPPPPAPAEKCTDTQIDSLGTPMYLRFDQTVTDNTASSALEESEPPQEFLSNSPDFPPTQKDSVQGKNKLNLELDVERSELDEIQLLMELLNLSDFEGQGETTKIGFDLGCDDEFYGKIVGARGPKSIKEAERLEGWIKHFLNGGAGAGEVKEPFRLAHLLLGKSAFLNSLEGSDGLGGFEFPSTIDEFLLNDPPIY